MKPIIHKGTRFSQIKASQWQELFDCVEGLRAMTIEGFNKGETNGQIAFVDGRRSRQPQFPDRYVVVTKDPVAADTMLKVREVRYDADRPLPCTEADPSVCRYEWYGHEFDAYPVPGKRVTDYSDLYQSATEPLTVDTPVSRCIRNHGVWIVEPRPTAEGGGGIRFGVVDTVPTSGASVVHVQPLKRSGATYAADGPAKDFPLWGNQKGDDFATLVGGVGSVTADIIPLVTVAGVEYAMQYFWLFARTPNATIPRGDCGL